MRLSTIKLSGFKSFVDPTELLIGEGLTGIVGPNGCGKSNLVEALRWAMGETSAKQMRGSEMDDMIFAGTAHTVELHRSLTPSHFSCIHSASFRFSSVRIWSRVMPPP